MQRLIAFYGNDNVLIYAVMTYISGVLYYLSTCINPLLYNIMSNKFREAFKVCTVASEDIPGVRHLTTDFKLFRYKYRSAVNDEMNVRTKFNINKLCITVLRMMVINFRVH